MGNSGIEFDHIMAEKLKNLSGDISSEGWMSMSNKLDAELPRTEGQIFDSLLRSKITTSESDLPGDWPTLQSDLDKLKTADAQQRFDKILYPKLGFIKHDRGANWPQLMSQLEEWELVHRRIISTRIVEAFMVILLLIVGYGSFNSVFDVSKAHVGHTSSADQAIVAEHIENDQQRNQVSESIIKHSKNNNKTKAFIASPINKEANKFSIKKNALLPELKNKDYYENNINSFINNNKEINLQLVAFSSQKKNIQKEVKVIKTIETSAGPSILNVKPTPMVLTLLDQEISPLATEPTLDTKQIQPVIQILNKKAFSDGWSRVLSVSLDEHFIATPFDREFQLNALQRFSKGYGGSIRFNKTFGEWNIESGVAYHFINYVPKEFFVVDGGSLSNGYDLVKHASTELHFVEIPLEFQRTILQGRKLRLFTNAGASANINVASTYTFERFNQKNSLSRPTPRVNQAPPKILEDKDYSSGALEGGSITDNSYFTANVGLGIDYHVSEKLNLFFQTTYHHRIGGSKIGPNEDKFHLTSFNLGIKLPVISD